MKFIIDTQLPPSLADYFVAKGYDAIHTTFFPDGHLLKDKEIILISMEEDRIITTKDFDFYEHFVLKGSPPKTLLLQIGNISNSDLFSLMENNFNSIISAFQQDAGLVIITKQEMIIY